MNNTQDCLFEAIWSSNSITDIAKLIVQGADVNAVDNWGDTPLHAAAFYGDPETVSVLLTYGAHINAQNLRGLTPLHQAVLYGQMDMVALLVEHGADVTLPTARGETALHFAALYDRAWSYRLLLEAGADGSVCDNSGAAPFGIAKRQAEMVFARDIPNFVDIKHVSKHEYICPYCLRIIKTWEIDPNDGLQSLPSGPLVTDGDTIFGIDKAVELTPSDPCYYSLESACGCPRCGEQGFFVSVVNMSRKYDFRESVIESRLLFNVNYGTEELFKAHLNQPFLCKPALPLKLWRHYANPNDGCWHIVEYKSPDFPPMVVHRFGPFRCDIGSICGPSGVCACTAGHSWEWQLATGIITELWPVFWAIAEERQWVWEHDSEQVNCGGR